MNCKWVRLLVVVYMVGPSMLAGRLLASGSEPKIPACFKAIVKPGGWELPNTTGVNETGPYIQAGIPAHVTYVRWRTTESVWLPWYYVSDNRLMLDSHQFEFDSLTRLEIQGRPFAIFGFAKGRGVGMAANVRWLDRDGDGVFEELEWFPDLATVPSWVLELSAKEEGK